jgi:hypothetical protein
MHSVCQVNGANLSLAYRQEKYLLSGSAQEKTDAKTLYLLGTLSVEFLPLDFLTELPNINGLIIQSPNWPIVKSGFFTKDFKKIQHLYLDQSNIKMIAANAFLELTELKWIALWNNQIDYLKRETFQHNLKLEYVNFNGNRIKMINPKFFDHLEKLVEVNFANNLCVDKSYDLSKTSLDDVRLGFNKCFEDCQVDENCNPPLDDLRLEVAGKFDELTKEITRLKSSEKDLQTRVEKLESNCLAKSEFQDYSRQVNEQFEKLENQTNDDKISSILTKVQESQEKLMESCRSNELLVKKIGELEDEIKLMRNGMREILDKLSVVA